MDPYKILGLKKSADRMQVRAAFRRLSKTAHPDVGGDPQAFTELSLAHSILSDVERRAFYDLHGFDRGPGTDLEQQAVSVVATILQQVLTSDSDPTLVDILSNMKQHIRKEIEIAKDNLRKLERAEHRVGQLRKRFTRKGNTSGSLIDNILAGQNDHLSRARFAQQQQIAFRERAIEILSEYKFDFENPQLVTRAFRSNAFSTSTPASGY